MTNDIITGKQLLIHLQENKNKEVFSITGYVKLQEDESHETVLFNARKRSAKWVSIPVSMLESVEILGKTIQDGKILTAAQLFLNKPSSEEGSFLADIINLIDLNNEVNTGINDGTLPLSFNRRTGIDQNLLFTNSVVWLGSWQVGNG